MLKQNKAITLIALIITIIVLLILAGITINVVLGENGLFNKAKTSVGKYEKEQEKENSVLAGYENEIDKSINNIRAEEQKIIAKLEETSEVTDISYKSEGQEFIAPEDGYYKIECWGAQGGSHTNTTGGKGAYAKGIIKLSKNEKLYAYVGECYNGAKGTMSFNGGGHGEYSSGRMKTNGGGATDVRLINGEWDDFNSLKSRIIVAGGGSGVYDNDTGVNFRCNGSAAGGLFAREGGVCGSKTPTLSRSSGATQTSGGIDANNSGANYSGQFGKGASVIRFDSPAGGGGYYGGSSGGYEDCVVYGSTGGSSYISGYEGCNSISRDSTENNIIHTEEIIHYSGKYFLYTQMIDGDSYMPSHANKSINVIGNSGNGHVKITKMRVETK